MKRALLYLSTGFLFALLQTAFLAQIPLQPLKPEFILLLTIYIALHEPLARGALIVYLCGCLYDVFAGPFPGLHGLAFLLLYFMTRIFSGRMNTESSGALLFLVTVGTVLHMFNIFFLLAYFAEVTSSVWLIFRQIFPQLLLNLVAAGLLIVLLSAVQRRFPRLTIPGIQRLDEAA